jgi:erythrin-vacuolar iron transport family protein
LRAARHSNDTAIRQLPGDLAAEERRYEARAEELESEFVPAAVAKDEGRPNVGSSSCRSCNPGSRV